MTGIDAILWQSARNLLDAQENLNKLFEAFWQVICSDTDLKIEKLSQDEPALEFFQPIWNTYFQHRRNNRANGKIVGTVTIAIQLTANEGTEAVWPDGKRSKVFVGYSVGIGRDNAWVFTTDAPNQAGFFADCVPERLFWRPEESDDKSWFYAVPLELLTNAQRVQELVVSPVHEILRRWQVDDVFGAISSSLNKIEASLCLPPQPSAAE